MPVLARSEKKRDESDEQYRERAREYLMEIERAEESLRKTRKRLETYLRKETVSS